jgi:hypothetical protein
MSRSWRQTENDKLASENQQIAQTILEQFGGRRLAVMTGAFNFYAIERGLQFQLKHGAKDSINKVRIVLTYSDDYTVTFYKGAGVEVALVDGIYADQLQDIFEQYTGLFTTLFARQ